MKCKIVGIYSQGSQKSGKYLRLDEVNNPINTYLSLEFEREIKIFPGTLNLIANPDETFQINRYVRKHGQWFPRSPKSLPYWLLPATAFLIHQNQLVEPVKIAILYPLAKTDNKSIEIVSDKPLKEYWNLEANVTSIYLELDYEQTNKTNN